MKRKWILSLGSLGLAFILAFGAGAKKEYAAISFDGVEILTDVLEGTVGGYVTPVLDIAALENGPISFTIEEEEISYLGGFTRTVDLSANTTADWEPDSWEMAIYDGELPGEEEWDAYILQKVQASLWQSKLGHVNALYAHPIYRAGREQLSTTLQKDVYDQVQAWLDRFLKGEIDTSKGDFAKYLDKFQGYFVGLRFGSDLKLGSTSELMEVARAIIVDNPFGLYWFNSKYAVVPDNGICLGFEINPEYMTPDGQVLLLTNSVEVAVANIQTVVSQNAGKSDYEKLLAYYRYIIDITDYNYDAIKGNEVGSIKNAHNLIWVFDGDPETRVVCEGYAKAFKYLCDLSDFQSDIQVYLTSGRMGISSQVVNGVFPSGVGHMWNIVTIGGENYFVDVTNGDGASNLRFFLDYVEFGNVDTYYAMNSGMTYKYEDIYVYGPDIMTIANHPYSQTSGEGELIPPNPDSVEESEEKKDPEVHVHKKQQNMPPVVPTCTTPGSKEYYVCSCGEAFLDEACTESYTADEVMLPATGHHWENDVCTSISEEIHGIHCRDCNDLKEEYHSFDAGSITKQPTEKEPGIIIYTCEKCQETKTESIPELAHQHKIKWIEAVKPTCLEDGRKAYYCCDECNKIFSDSMGTTEITENDLIVKKLGHAFDSKGWKYYDGTQHRTSCSRGCGTYAFGAHGDSNSDGKCDKCGAIASSCNNTGGCDNTSTGGNNNGSSSGSGNTSSGTGSNTSGSSQKPASIPQTTTTETPIAILNGVLEIPTITLPQPATVTKTGTTQPTQSVNSSNTKTQQAAQGTGSQGASVSKADTQTNTGSNTMTSIRKKKRTSNTTETTEKSETSKTTEKSETTKTTEKSETEKTKKTETEAASEQISAENKNTDTKPDTDSIEEKKPTDITEELEKPDSYGQETEAQAIAENAPTDAQDWATQMAQGTSEGLESTVESTGVGGVLDQYQSEPLSMGAVMNLVQNEPMLVAIPVGVLLLTLIAGIGFIVVKAKAKKEEA